MGFLRPPQSPPPPPPLAGTVLVPTVPSPAWPGAVTHCRRELGLPFSSGAGPLQGHSPRDRVLEGLLPATRWGGFLALLGHSPCVLHTPLLFRTPSCGHRPQGLGLKPQVGGGRVMLILAPGCCQLPSYSLKNLDLAPGVKFYSVTSQLCDLDK